MSIEQFPEIETFQKLPRKVIVKGGNSGFDAKGRPELSGIVINNAGHSIRDITVFIVIFDEQEIPILNKSVRPTPSGLAQGGIASYTFVLQDWDKEITNFYLYVNWNYDDSNW